MAQRRTLKQRKNAKSTANKLSTFLLATNKIVRDYNAINTGKIAPRIERRIKGKIAS